jgi:hypothetical protein
MIKGTESAINVVGEAITTGGVSSKKEGEK